MSDLIIRPTSKFLKAGAVLAAVVVLGLEIAWFALWRDIAWLNLLPYVAPVVFLWPAVRALRRRFSKAVITGDRLRYETGITSKATRNIQLSKLQDVRVDQRLVQRLWSVGNISIETAGEASRLTIPNVDDPQALADQIMNLAHKAGGGV